MPTSSAQWEGIDGEPPDRPAKCLGRHPFVLLAVVLVLLQVGVRGRGLSRVAVEITGSFPVSRNRANTTGWPGCRLCDLGDRSVYCSIVAAGTGWSLARRSTTVRHSNLSSSRESVASIGDVAMAPSDPNVVWVGTGEANLRNSTYYGNGVYRSLDGGATWTHQGLGRVAPYRAGSDSPHRTRTRSMWPRKVISTRRIPERGVFKTTDGGETWTKIPGCSRSVAGAYRCHRSDHGSSRIPDYSLCRGIRPPAVSVELSRVAGPGRRYLQNE